MQRLITLSACLAIGCSGAPSAETSHQAIIGPERAAIIGPERLISVSLQFDEFNQPYLLQRTHIPAGLYKSALGGTDYSLASVYHVTVGGVATTFCHSISFLKLTPALPPITHVTKNNQPPSEFDMVVPLSAVPDIIGPEHVRTAIIGPERGIIGPERSIIGPERSIIGPELEACGIIGPE